MLIEPSYFYSIPIEAFVMDASYSCLIIIGMVRNKQND